MPSDPSNWDPGLSTLMAEAMQNLHRIYMRQGMTDEEAAERVLQEAKDIYQV